MPAPIVWQYWILDMVVDSGGQRGKGERGVGGTGTVGAG